MPSWALAIPVVLALGVAGWLFLAPLVGDEPASKRAPKEDRATEQEPVEGVLDLGEEAAEDEDPDSSDGADGATTTVTELPALLDALDGIDVVLAPASANGPTGRVRISGVRVSCVGEPAPTRLAAERAALDALGSLLERAGARVTRLDTDGAVECIDERIAAQEDARATIIVRGASTTPRAKATVQAGRSIPAAAGDGATDALVAELAATMRAARPAPSRLRDELLLASGAVDQPGGGSIVLVELPTLDDQAAIDAAALAIARGIAGAVVRDR